MTDRTGERGQDSQQSSMDSSADRSAVSGQPIQYKEEKMPQHDSKDRAVGAGQLAQDSQDRTARTGQTARRG